MFRTEAPPWGDRDCGETSCALQPVAGGMAAAAPQRFEEPGVIVGSERELSKGLKGTFLQETIVLRDSAGKALVAAAMDALGRARQLRRKRHSREVEHEQQLLSCILANGLRCQWFRAAPLVSFQRKADAQFYGRRNRPVWLSARAVGRAVEGLERAGLAHRHVGYRGLSSGYVLDRALLLMAHECGVSERSLGISFPREDLVRLRGCRPKPTFDTVTRELVRHEAERIYFGATPETEHWRDELEAYNNFIAMQDIAVDASDDALLPWLTDSNNDTAHRGAELRHPELFRLALYRVCNDGNPAVPKFDKGGRLAGAWWLNAPKEIRAFVTINGEPTVELDYSACHPRMLYHELGLIGPEDPYDIPQVAVLEQNDGRPAGSYRSLVKWQTQVLINGGSRPDLVAPPRDMLLPCTAALADVRRFIRETHEPIAEAFRSRAGLRLMKAESDIALSIIGTATRNGWPVLPVHDSFIAPISLKEETKRLMITEYKKRYPYEPTIK